MKQKENSKNIYIRFFDFFIYYSIIYTCILKKLYLTLEVPTFIGPPAKCAFNGINHYQAFIIGDKTCKIFMTQFGDYLQAFLCSYVSIYLA